MFLLLMPVLAEARMGESKHRCAVRYGGRKGTSKGLTKYKWNGYEIFIKFSRRGNAIRVTYSKDKLDPKKVLALNKFLGKWMIKNEYNWEVWSRSMQRLYKASYSSGSMTIQNLRIKK